MAMPKQQSSVSRQDYATPPDLIQAVRQLLGIKWFDFDFAADSRPTHHHAEDYWTIRHDSLSRSPEAWAERCDRNWGWLNPPFSRIAPWASHCWQAKLHGALIAFLVPAAVGSNWFRDYVDGKAHVLFLNGRPAFDPAHPTWGYPKDCMLCLYSNEEPAGYTVWNWRHS